MPGCQRARGGKLPQHWYCPSVRVGLDTRGGGTEARGAAGSGRTAFTKKVQERMGKGIRQKEVTRPTFLAAIPLP